MKYQIFNCGEIDHDLIDYHSWPEFYFSGFICTTASVVCITAMVNHILVRLSTSKGRRNFQAPPTKQDLGTT